MPCICHTASVAIHVVFQLGEGTNVRLVFGQEQETIVHAVVALEQVTNVVAIHVAFQVPGQGTNVRLVVGQEQETNFRVVVAVEQAKSVAVVARDLKAYVWLVEVKREAPVLFIPYPPLVSLLEFVCS